MLGYAGRVFLRECQRPEADSAGQGDVLSLRGARISSKKEQSHTQMGYLASAYEPEALRQRLRDFLGVSPNRPLPAEAWKPSHPAQTLTSPTVGNWQKLLVVYSPFPCPLGKTKDICLQLM